MSYTEWFNHTPRDHAPTGGTIQDGYDESKVIESGGKSTVKTGRPEVVSAGEASNTSSSIIQNWMHSEIELSSSFLFVFRLIRRTEEGREEEYSQLYPGSLSSNCISSSSSRAGEIKIGCANLLNFLFQTIGVYSTTKCGVELLYPNNYNSGRQK
jgi:hypothetical protein